MTFRVGQKVVCVDDGDMPGQIGNYWDVGEEIFKGATYTISRAFLKDGRPTVWLHEVRRTRFSAMVHGPDVGYGAERFRPLVERKTETGMAILNSILNDVNAGKQREIVDA